MENGKWKCHPHIRPKKVIKARRHLVFVLVSLLPVAMWLSAAVAISRSAKSLLNRNLSTVSGRAIKTESSLVLCCPGASS